MKKKASFPIAILSSLVGFSCVGPTVFNFFGKKDSADEKGSGATKTFIWGNGIYQPRPDAIMKFKNFEPKLIKSFLGPKSVNFKEIAFGEYHEGGITVNNQVYIWKKHVMDSSQSEDDDTRKDLILLDDGKNNKQLVFSRGFAWILKENGEVVQFQITSKISKEGDEESVEINVNKSPRKIEELKDIVQISCGEDHFAALDKNGEVWTMGDDTLGQCGIGAQKRNSSPPFFEKRVRKPQKVSLSNIKKIVCGGHHTLALNGDGVVYGWGSNNLLQLSHEEEFATATNPLLAVFSPLRIEKDLNNLVATDIAAGDDFSIIAGRNRHNQETEVYGCGSNLNGQLGAGNVSHIQEVIKIESLSNYKVKTDQGEKDIRVNQISCGKNHCMALLSVGAVIEWGANEWGQLGNRKRVFSENPIIIKEFTEENVLKVCCGQNNSAVITEYNQKLEEQKKATANPKKSA